MLGELLTITLLTVAGPSAVHSEPAACRAPDYYAIELFTTRNIPGTGVAKAWADVSIPSTSPFSISLSRDGSYVYDVTLRFERLKTPRAGKLVGWVTTPDIDEFVRMGALNDDLRATGQTRWNKFIVVVTLEADDDPAQERWSGPVVFRGMSVSGKMHTMVGHGALQQENCAAYGYGN